MVRSGHISVQLRNSPPMSNGLWRTVMLASEHHGVWFTKRTNLGLRKGREKLCEQTVAEVDLSRMIDLPRCAVMCRNKEELESFYEVAKHQLSRFMHWDFEEITRLWNVYGFN